jgi:hypothetical protein
VRRAKQTERISSGSLNVGKVTGSCITCGLSPRRPEDFKARLNENLDARLEVSGESRRKAFLCEVDTHTGENGS